MRPIFVNYRDEIDRFVAFDRIPRRVVRMLLRRSPQSLSGMRRVVRNFLTGLERAGVPYRYNALPFGRTGQPVISFGLGPMGLAGVGPRTPVIAAIGFPYPCDFPDLPDRCDLHRVLVHSEWVRNLVRRPGVYDPDLFALWAAGIDTEHWTPTKPTGPLHVLIYTKMKLVEAGLAEILLKTVIDYVEAKGLSWERVNYGSYNSQGYRASLARAGAAIFLSPHESQGFAYLEALSSGVPVCAWDPGTWLDPDRVRLGLDHVPTCSVPFFDERCGETFHTPEGFANTFDQFVHKVRDGGYLPRDYVLENLTIEHATARMLDFYSQM